jgi:hypothetical protein
MDQKFPREGWVDICEWIWTMIVDGFLPDRRMQEKQDQTKPRAASGSGRAKSCTSETKEELSIQDT